MWQMADTMVYLHQGEVSSFAQKHVLPKSKQEAMSGHIAVVWSGANVGVMYLKAVVCTYCS